MQSGLNEGKEKNLAISFPNTNDSSTEVHRQPLTVRDLHGRVLAWYLPEAFSPTAQVSDLRRRELAIY